MPRLRGDEFYLEATGLRTELAARFIFMTGCRRPNVVLAGVIYAAAAR